jgi:hypothetical protein
MRPSQMGRFYCCRTRGRSPISISASRTGRQHLGKIAHVLFLAADPRARRLQ